MLVPGPAEAEDAFYGALVEDDAEELYERAPCAYLSTLPDGTIVKVNQTFLTWTGHDRQDLVGRVRFQELLAPGDRIFYETHYGPALRMQGAVREIAVEVVCANRTRLPVLVNAVLTHDEEGHPAAIRTALFDATERRAYEQELLAARHRAEESEARARALARTLQSTFLPPALIAVPGLDLGGGYRPAGDGAEVGGDFYDVFEIDDRRVGLVLGDVQGKGAAAAVVTALARYTVRAEAQRSPRPSVVLGRLHTTLLREQPDNFCTAALLVVTRDEGSVAASLSSGGHPLAIRRRADGTTTRLGAPGSMLGMIDDAVLGDEDTVLAPGEVVVLYTDGVTEARRGAEFFGEERLERLVRSHRGTAQDLADAIVEAGVDFQHGTTRDDIAVLVLAVR